MGIEQDACAFDAHIILIWNEVIMGMEQEQTPHKRRVRYKGKYPKKYEEKYKELQPEKYGDTIAHVISKGNTPAGMHRSIMVQEILDFLKIQPGETGFDATLGYGGHTKAMLEQLQGRGHIYATDVDPEESAKTRKRLADAGYGEDILTIKLQNFCTIDEIAKEAGGFDFILADLGVSSMQIDNPERGFSFKVDGPLDLRLNQTQGISAAERLDMISREELAGMLYENSDEPYCEELAKAITDEIRKGQIEMLCNDMAKEYEAGNYVLCGGDFNHDLKASEEDTESCESWAFPFPRTELPEHFDFCLDLLSSEEQAALWNSARNADMEYVPGVTYTVTLDGFIISDNIECLSYENVNTGYSYSDHDPVKVEFMLR